jgi:alpha-L-arabinofuranosidase
VDTAINLRGAERVEPAGAATVLAGDPKAMNSLDQPTNVTPKQEKISDAAASFRRTFPAHSFTIVRLTATAQ